MHKPGKQPALNKYLSLSNQWHNKQIIMNMNRQWHNRIHYVFFKGIVTESSALPKWNRNPTSCFLMMLHSCQIYFVYVANPALKLKGVPCSFAPATSDTTYTAKRSGFKDNIATSSKCIHPDSIQLPFLRCSLQPIRAMLANLHVYLLIYSDTVLHRDLASPIRFPW